MRRLARISRVAGVVGLLSLGALALHELRYLLAFGGGAATELERTGHGYLDLLAPVLVALALATIVVSVVAPAILRAAPSLGDGGYLTERAAGYAAALLTVHLAQELTEGLLHGGHAGVAHAFEAGGVLVLPLAMALGALAALARGWLERAERRLAAALERGPLPRAPRRIGCGPVAPTFRTLTTRCLQFGIARRPPPLGQLG
jgi:hypothetical protein